MGKAVDTIDKYYHRSYINPLFNNTHDNKCKIISITKRKDCNPLATVVSIYDDNQATDIDLYWLKKIPEKEANMYAVRDNL